MSISEQVVDYAKEVHNELKKHGVRSILDISDRTMQYKIRDAKMKEVPYTIILGKNEAEVKTISIRTRSGKQNNNIGIEAFIEQVIGEIRERNTAAP